MSNSRLLEQWIGRALFTLAIPVWILCGSLSAEAYAPPSEEHLLKTYAPVFVQEVGRKPLYDLITQFDFDGDASGYNNVANSLNVPIPASVYGSVVAETPSAWFLFYGVYHLRDYDKPIREFFFVSAAHDNDFEGTMIVVSKRNGSIQAIETWFHNIFLQCAHDPLSLGSQSIDGKIHTEEKTHPILYVPSAGHGVRCFQKIDEPLLSKRPHQIYRHGENFDGNLHHQTKMAVIYQLVPLDLFFKQALGPFNAESALAEPGQFGLGEKPIGKYLSGNFKGDTSWARPKPPWSWSSKFDNQRPGAWFFHPAHVFNQHFGLGISEHYSKNGAVHLLFGVSQETLDQWVTGDREKTFFGIASKNFFASHFRKFKKNLYRLIEPLFFYFG